MPIRCSTWISLEALSNAVRHSGGQAVRVSLVSLGVSALLEVSDDGSGFDVASSGAIGHGLSNLRARAEALGGELDIESESGKGTWVRVRIPF